MTEVENILSQIGVTPTWDDEVKQNYATWESEGSTYEVWVEDASSLEPETAAYKRVRTGGKRSMASWI